MSFVVAFIWLFLSLAVSFLSLRYYLPYYAKKNTNAPDISNSSNSGSKIKDILSGTEGQIFVFVLIGIYSAICGYFAFRNTYYTNVISLVKLSIVMLILVAVCITDLKMMVIPNLLVLFMLIGRLVCFIVELLVYGKVALSLFVNNLIVGLLVLVILFIMSKLTKGGLGAGDVKLYGSLAFMCGFGCAFYTLFLTLIVSAIFSIVLLILKKKRLKDSFPMGPFILFGYGLTIIFALA